MHFLRSGNRFSFFFFFFFFQIWRKSSHFLHILSWTDRYSITLNSYQILRYRRSNARVFSGSHEINGVDTKRKLLNHISEVWRLTGKYVQVTVTVLLRLRFLRLWISRLKCLLGRDIVWHRTSSPTFRRNVLPPASGSKTFFLPSSELKILSD
jgi:hypothetical protein